MPCFYAFRYFPKPFFRLRLYCLQAACQTVYFSKTLILQAFMINGVKFSQLFSVAILRPTAKSPQTSPTGSAKAEFYYFATDEYF